MSKVRFAVAFLSIVLAGVASRATGAGLPKVPDDFEVRLVASVPAVLYPSQVATAPGGLLFVGEDPMDQPGPTDQPIDRILLLRDGKEPTVFAEKLNAIFGMAWREGSLYVMNMPHLTVLRDTDGDGRADQRTELFTDLGVPPGSPNNLNDHIVSGIQFGIDGWLYISVGDKGVPKATGPDGGTVQLIGGGILRCRPDGTKIEVFSRGTRNHLEPNLDDRDNLFTYDNTDDGDGWWTRVTHHVNSGYYGYPYDYHKFTYRMIPRMAEFGGGSPCGGIVYNEDAWPEKYRGRAFWAEWGKRHVAAFAFKAKGASFEIGDMTAFASPGDSGAFHPIDLALSYDGKTMFIADWGTGGWGKKDEKVGRVYAVSYKGTIPTRPRGNDSDSVAAQIKQLDHPSLNERTRAQLAIIRKGKQALPGVVAKLEDRSTNPVAARHLIWTLDAIAGGTAEASQPIMKMLSSPVPDLRAQAARALGIRQVAISLPALRGLLGDADPTVRLQAIIALGRIGDPAATLEIIPILADDDIYLAFTARQALRKIGDWRTVGSALAKTTDPKLRSQILETLELVFDLDAAQVLAKEALDTHAKSTDERAKALSYLATEHRMTRPWDGKWWGTRPTQGTPPAKEVEWVGTKLVLETLRGGLKDRAPEIRLAAVSGLIEAGDKASLPTLRRLFASEKDAAVKGKIASAFGEFKDQASAKALISALRDAKVADSVRDAALESLEKLGGDVAVKALVDLLNQRDLAVDRQPKVILALGKMKAKAGVQPIMKRLKSPAPKVRAAAAEAMGKIGVGQGVSSSVAALIEDADVEVRKAAIAAVGALGDHAAVAKLIAASDQQDTRFEAMLAVAKLPEIQALPVYLRGLGERSQEIRRASASAIAAIRDQAAPVLDQLAARRELPGKLIPELKKIFRNQQPIVAWKVIGPVPIDLRIEIPSGHAPDFKATLMGVKGTPVAWKSARARATDGEVNLGVLYDGSSGQAAFGYAEINSSTPRTAQISVGSDDTLTVWLNGKQMFEFKDDRGFELDKDRFDAPLVSGVNRLLIKCGNHGGGWQYAVSVSAASDYSFLKTPEGTAFNPDAYRTFAQSHNGNAEHGKALFSDLKGLACLKCHAVSGQGGKVGPELGGVGAKYPKEELITSVLYPSAKISSGYEPVVIATADGRVVTGIVKSETPKSIEIEDGDAKRQTIAKEDIDERKPSAVSLMPNGLAEGLTPSDFADLIAYIATLKDINAGTAKAGGR